MSKRRKNAGEGYGYMFSGAFAKKADAVKKEKTRKGSFIKGRPTPHGYRYIVMTPRTNPVKRKNRVSVFFDNGIQKFTATQFHDKFGNVYASGFTKKEAVKNLRDELRRARKEKTWRNPTASGPNPAELIVMGANPNPSPTEFTVPAGSTITIRTNPANGLFGGLHRAILGEARERYPAAGFRSPVHAIGRRTSRTSDSELVSALRNLGYSSAASKSAARGATGSDFDSRFRSAMDALRHNPACGVTINPGGHSCTREPGHKGPHLPQGATLRPRSRLPHNWRGNPSAAAIREEFTGAPAEHFTVQDEPHMPAGDYAQLGELLALYVKPIGGGQVQQINFKTQEERPIVVSDESARQIYFVGGAQDVTPALSIFDTRGARSSGVYRLGECRRIDYKQRKEHVGHPDADEWRHNFGEESGVKPTLLFDALTKRLLLEGGEYVIRAEGIVN